MLRQTERRLWNVTARLCSVLCSILCGGLLALVGAAAPARGQAVREQLFPDGEYFQFEGRDAFILRPQAAQRSQPQPWVFYAPTLRAYPDKAEEWMHRQFLQAGIAVAGIDVGEAYCSPESRTIFDRFYAELTERRGLKTKPCLLGRSRGGLWVSSWACDHPERFSGLAGIYPVYDFRTYPGLEKTAAAYHLTVDQLQQQLTQLNPIARAAAIARARLPVFIIHGDEDKVVPLEQNSAALAELYRQAGASDAIELKIAKGQGHNFWEGFFKCQELVDFVIKRARSE